jgi:hypothetical protein
MMFNTIFNNISVIWRSVLLVEETGIPGENRQPAVKIIPDKLYHRETYQSETSH